MNDWIKNILTSMDVAQHRHIVFIMMLLLTINSMSAMDNNVSTVITYSDTTSISHKTDDLISRNLFVEFGGPSLGIGIGYDQRFKPNSVFGFRTGISFTNGSWDDNGWFGYQKNDYTSLEFKGVTLPLEANAIMGKRASKFELGIGATPCILHRHEEHHYGWYDDHRVVVKDGVKLNIFGTLNIGYRLQRKSGFFMRAGLTFVIGDLKYSPIDALLLIPNLSLGYTIK